MHVVLTHQLHDNFYNSNRKQIYQLSSFPKQNERSLWRNSFGLYSLEPRKEKIPPAQFPFILRDICLIIDFWSGFSLTCFSKLLRKFSGRGMLWHTTENMKLWLPITRSKPIFLKEKYFLPHFPFSTSISLGLLHYQWNSSETLPRSPGECVWDTWLRGGEKGRKGEVWTWYLSLAVFKSNNVNCKFVSLILSDAFSSTL